MRFPECPRVVVTNVFLTGAVRAETYQFIWYQSITASVTALRSARELEPLNSVFDLYEADRVLLADPSPMVGRFGDLPDHYQQCGAIYWKMRGTLPPELRNKNDLLLASMGSTGLSLFGKSMIGAVMKKAGCSSSVFVGTNSARVEKREVFEFHFDHMPLEDLLPRCRIVLCQGGSGSVYQALAHGKPLIVSPGHQNHRILGALIQEMGLGICLESDNLCERLGDVDFKLIGKNAIACARVMREQDGANAAAMQMLEML